jgi:hypothetical protein
MGQDWRPDLAISPQLMQRLLARVETQIMTCAINGNFCPGLHPLLTMRLAIYAVIWHVSSAIRCVFPDCAGLQMQSFRVHATRCSAILPFLTLLSTHDPVHFHKHDPRCFCHDILIP